MFCLGCLHLLVIGREKPIIPETPKPKKTNGSRADQTGYNYNGLHNTNTNTWHEQMKWVSKRWLSSPPSPGITTFEALSILSRKPTVSLSLCFFCCDIRFYINYIYTYIYIYIYIYRVNNHNPCESEDNRAFTRPPWLPYSRPWWHH